MTARQIIVPGAMPSRDANGRALPAKLRFYMPGTTIPATVYTTSALNVAHPFPILSDDAGRFASIWADDANSFDVVWSDQVYDKTIAAYGDVQPLADAVQASVTQSEASAAAAMDAATEAAASALEAAALLAEQTGQPFTATSSSPLSIGTGNKTLVLNQTGKLFSEGQIIVAAATATPSDQMIGVVQAVSDQTLIVKMSITASPDGVGPYSAWTVSLASLNGVASVAGLSGIVTANDLLTALNINSLITSASVALAIAL